MKNITRRFRLAQLLLVTFVLPGCASAIDDGAAPSPSEDATASESESLKGAAANADAVLDADPADCDAAPATAGAQTDAYREFTSIMESANLSVDAAPAGNSCTAACRCCKWGNRFCCSHCRWCSGPIGTSGGVLAK